MMRTIFLARWGSQANEALLTSYEAESREQCLENYVKPTKKRGRWWVLGCRAIDPSSFRYSLRASR